MPEQNSLKILFASSEVAPFAKTGGLADVAGSLPHALLKLGHDVRIVMPRYKTINCPMETRLDFPVMIGGRKETAVIREQHLSVDQHDACKGIPVYFVDNYHYFDRDHLYCYCDEAERFAFFCRAMVEMLPLLDFRPDLIHCNDWQTGPVPVILRECFGNDPFFRDIATLFTVHNLRYQGNYPRENLRLLGLPDDYYHPEKLEFYGEISFLKAGLVYADVLNTVSKTYAREIQTAEYGERMEGLLRKRSSDLYGIINGIDYHEFDPAADSHIISNYDYRTVQKKRDNKYSLQKQMKLPVQDVPVLGLISRLVDQKGLDLLEGIFDRLMGMDLQLIVLGTGDPHYEEFFRKAVREYPEKFAAHIGFNVALAQQIYAGSDMFLMPSRYEPCGLGQLISLRYGTIPIVRATGGLADTITEYNPLTGTGNGFTFMEYAQDKFMQAIKRALQLHCEKPDLWTDLVRHALKSDFSWTASASEYVRLYKTGVEKNKKQT